MWNPQFLILWKFNNWNIMETITIRKQRTVIMDLLTCLSYSWIHYKILRWHHKQHIIIVIKILIRNSFTLSLKVKDSNIPFFSMTLNSLPLPPLVQYHSLRHKMKAVNWRTNAGILISFNVSKILYPTFDQLKF